MSERDSVAHLTGKPFLRRVAGYVKLCGPGYMQSAMTLGASSIASCVLFGALMGYELLWINPLAILSGCFVLAAIAKQVCHTGERPYDSFKRRLHPALAVLWGASALVGTVVWHFPQYGLTANGVLTVGQAFGVHLDTTAGRVGIGALLLPLACVVVWFYQSGSKGVRVFEQITKLMVWGIVFAFACVALGTGIRLMPFLRGITGIAFLADWLNGGIDPRAVVPIVGGLAAALGLNMVFLYPYSLLRKGWEKDHQELAYFDLASGMAVPFIFATTFMVIAVANTIGPAEGAPGKVLSDIREVIPVLAPSLGKVLGSEQAGLFISQLMLGFGMSAIGFTTVVMQMLACGFIGCEMTGRKHDGLAPFLFALIPVVGVCGVMIKLPWQAAVLGASLNAPLMPVATLCFMILLNQRSFMGEQTPRGWRRFGWNTALGVSILLMTSAAYFGIRSNLQTYRAKRQAREAAHGSTSAHSAPHQPDIRFEQSRAPEDPDERGG